MILSTVCNRTSWIPFSVFRNFTLFHSVGLLFSTRTYSRLQDLTFSCHWALLSRTSNKLQNLSWSWNGRDLTKRDPVWCYVAMPQLCSHEIPKMCLLRDLRSIMWSWHTTWLTWSHASASSKMRGLILLHHKEIMCLSIYLNCVSGFSSVARYCWECDRRLLRNWNNSGDKRSGPGKATRSGFSWMKALLSWAEAFELFLAFGQQLCSGKMEKPPTLYCTGNTLLWFCSCYWRK